MGEIFTMATLEWDQTLYTITWVLAFVIYFSIKLCGSNGQVLRSEAKFGEASKNKEVKCGVKLEALKYKF